MKLLCAILAGFALATCSYHLLKAMPPYGLRLTAWALAFIIISYVIYKFA